MDVKRIAVWGDILSALIFKRRDFNILIWRRRGEALNILLETPKSQLFKFINLILEGGSLSIGKEERSYLSF